MPTYKLTYFNGRARGETTRMLFTLGGVPFEDKRVEFADWPALKPSTPWGALPYLEVDGKALGQSLAVHRYVAKQVGMAGKTPLDAALVDSVVDTVTELMDKFFPLLFMKDETEKAAAIKEFAEKQLEPKCVNLEKFLGNNKGGKGFFVSEGMTFADVHFYIGFENVQKLFPDVFSKATKLGGLFERITKDPKVAAYLEKRPKTDF